MVLLVLTSCRLKDTRQAYPEDEGTAQQQQAVSQSGKHEDPEAEQGLPRESAAGNAGAPGNAKAAGGAGLEEPGTAVSAVQNLGARNQLITGRFFKAGDIRCGLSFELTGEGWESERLKCVFTLPDEMHTSYYDSMRSAEILTERGKRTYKISPETME